MKKRWHSLELADIERELKTDFSDGLSVREARRRLEYERKNDGGERYSLFVHQTEGAFLNLFSFILSPAVILLSFVALFAAVFGEAVVGLCVLTITLVGALIGGAVKMSAHRKINAMRDFSSPAVRVIRGGKKYYTDGRNIVEGDLIILKNGDLAVCDARIINSQDLTVRELFNTVQGIRNREVRKDHSRIYSSDEHIDTSDACNMLYAGSVVKDGYALCVAVETGRDVYLSRFLKSGELSGEKSECKGIKVFKPLFHRISFFSLAALVILSLVSIVTLKETSFADNFMMLAASVAMISLDMIETAASNVFSTCIERSARARGDKNGSKTDLEADIRDVGVIDTLTDVNTIVLLGDAGLYEAEPDFGEVYTVNSTFGVLPSKEKAGKRILTYIYSYLRALSESGVENSLVLDGYADALRARINASELDVDGIDLVIRSLYFLGDESGDRGFACVETTMGEYRVALTFDESILSLCRFAGTEDNEERCEIEKFSDDIAGFCSRVKERGGRCLYIVSEIDGVATLEGIMATYRKPAAELNSAIRDLEGSGVSVKAALLKDDLLTSELLSVFDGKIAYADDFRSNGNDITFNSDKYSLYVGFSKDEYCTLIDHMRRNGNVVAAYGVGDEYYDVMARADLSVSCDILRYSSEKYKESLYERLPTDGRDTSTRASQRMRLLSRVLVHRSHKGSGGLLAISNALHSSRAAYVSLAQSLLIFAMLMSSFLPMVAISALTGVYLLNAVQAAALSFAAAVICITVYVDSVPNERLIKEEKDFIRLPVKILEYKLPGIIGRAALSVIFGIVLLVLDLLKVFGSESTYMMPVFISLLFAMFVELFIINVDYTRRGEGRRRCLVRVMAVYTALLAICALITLPPLSNILFENGIGTYEFIVAIAYCLCYTAVVLIARSIERKRKK